MFCFEALASASIAAEACCRIWFFAKLVVSNAKSASSMPPLAADRFDELRAPAPALVRISDCAPPVASVPTIVYVVEEELDPPTLSSALCVNIIAAAVSSTAAARALGAVFRPSDALAIELIVTAIWFLPPVAVPT